MGPVITLVAIVALCIGLIVAGMLPDSWNAQGVRPSGHFPIFVCVRTLGGVAEWIWVLVRQGWLGSGQVRARARALTPGRYRTTIVCTRRRRLLVGGGCRTHRGPPSTAPPSALVAVLVSP